MATLIVKTSAEHPKVGVSDPLATSSLPEQMMFNGDITSGIFKADSLHDRLGGETPVQAQKELSGHVATIGGAVNSFVISILNFFRGKVFACKGYQNKDDTKLATGIMRMIRGASEFYSNGATLSGEGITLAQKADGLKNVIAGLAIASTAGTSTVATIVASTAALSLKELYTTSKKFEEKRKEMSSESPTDEQVNGAFEELEKLAKITGVDQAEVVAEINGTKQASCFSLFQSLFGNEKTRLALQIRAFLNKPPVNQEEIVEKKAAILDKAKELCIHTKIDEFKGDHHDLKNLLATIEIERKEEGKKEKFIKVFGKEAFDIVTKTENPDKAKKLEAIESAHQTKEKNKLINFAVAFLSVVSLALSVTLQVLSATPVGFAIEMVELGLSLLLTIGWIVIDGYFLIDAYQNESFSTKEKVMMALTTIASALCTLTSIVVLKMGSSLAKMIMPIGAVTLWIFGCLYSLYHAKNKKSVESAA